MKIEAETFWTWTRWQFMDFSSHFFLFLPLDETKFTSLKDVMDVANQILVLGVSGSQKHVWWLCNTRAGQSGLTLRSENKNYWRRLKHWWRPFSSFLAAWLHNRLMTKSDAQRQINCSFFTRVWETNSPAVAAADWGEPRAQNGGSCWTKPQKELGRATFLMWQGLGARKVYIFIPMERQERVGTSLLILSGPPWPGFTCTTRPRVHLFLLEMEILKNKL